MEEQEKIIEERKKKLKEFFLGKNIWVIAVLVIALILGIYLRSLPMTDHGGKPGLWDITTNDYTLGPDLDPFLFMRYAKDMVNGGLPPSDIMRNVPLGFDTSSELQMVSYAIVLTYKIVNLFGNYSINYAAAVMPVIFFALTIIAFFLFVREIFIGQGKNYRANLIALISTFFMIVIPIFLSRIIAGIPEKESIGFFFMFLSFYLFLKAWKSEKIKWASVFAALSGISTAFMGLSWGGVSYIYVTIAVAVLVAFILDKVHKKEFIVYALWIFFSWTATLLFTKRFSISEMVTSLDTGIALLLFFIIAVHFLLWNTRLSKIKFLQEIKIPKSILSLIIAVILGILIVSIVFGTSFIINKAKDFNQMMFRPVTGRWQTTVAENKQPYFTEWASSFGPFIKGIPILFWLFFIGSVVLFRKMLSSIKKKDAWILTCLYILFFFGLVFSRYSSTSMFDGESFASKLLYYGSALLFVGSIGYIYLKYIKEKNNEFEKLDFRLIFLLVLFVLCLFTARSAVRLIMTLGPTAPIFVAYLIIESIGSFKSSKEETAKIVFGVVVGLLIILSLFTFYSFYKEVKVQSYNYVPYDYTFQWQKAMAWVRNSTPENAVFAHWWDYGYWVQSIGNRATVTDGGNAIVWWNYLTGRLVLTGDNQRDALEFLYNHNTNYLLIDSSDLGKYGAFSSIGSDENMDRYSSGPSVFLSDASALKETKDSVVREYNNPVGNGMIAISPIEEDINFQQNNSDITLPKEKNGLIGLSISTSQVDNSTVFSKAEASFISSDRKITIVPIRYVYYNGVLTDFKEGINATAYVIPRISQSTADNFGAVIYISPRLMRGLLAQIYLLNDSLKNFPNFKLAHSEPNIIIDNINQQGYNFNEFSYIDGRGLEGPIKIWSIQYAGTEQVNPKYTDISASKYISWKL